MERGEGINPKDIWLLGNRELVVITFQKGVNQALQTLRAQTYGEADTCTWGDNCQPEWAAGAKVLLPKCPPQEIALKQALFVAMAPQRSQRTPHTNQLLTIGRVAKKLWAQQKQSAPEKCLFEVDQVWQIFNEKGELARRHSVTAKEPPQSKMIPDYLQNQDSWERALHFPLSVACRRESSGTQVITDTQEPAKVFGVGSCEEPRRVQGGETQARASFAQLRTRLKNVASIPGKSAMQLMLAQQVKAYRTT